MTLHLPLAYTPAIGCLWSIQWSRMILAWFRSVTQLAWSESGKGPKPISGVGGMPSRVNDLSVVTASVQAPIMLYIRNPLENRRECSGTSNLPTYHVESCKASAHNSLLPRVSHAPGEIRVRHLESLTLRRILVPALRMRRLFLMLLTINCLSSLILECIRDRLRRQYRFWH